MEINKLLPDLCKYESCLQKADYEFTDAETVSIEQEDELIKEEIKTIVIGHACGNHVTEVHKLLKEIYGDKNNG